MHPQCQEKNDIRVEKVATTFLPSAHSLHSFFRRRYAPRVSLVFFGLRLRLPRAHISTFLRSHTTTRTARLNKPKRSSAFDDVQREPGQARLFVARLHIEAGEIHGPDHLIE
jgi:hypothetical protein